MSVDKYQLYELSVQSPEVHVKWFASMFKDIFGKDARHLREDFCGTFKLACEWVKENEENTALGLDLDPEPIRYGKKNHWAGLSSDQQKRIKIMLADVLLPPAPKKDIIVACNFSFCIFKQREVLLKYFQKCVQSLNSKGALILELAGGPGMITSMRERKTVRISKKHKFLYIWHQKSFDPITHDAQYAIHFKLPNGKTLKDAFTYDWRLWGIPEVRDLLAEAGFGSSHIYWETTHKGEGTGEYAPTAKGDNSYAWVAYIVATRAPTSPPSATIQ